MTDTRSTAQRRADYEAVKARAIMRNLSASKAARDIGDIPPIVDHARLAKAERSFRVFCETYFPQRFGLAWSDDHLKVIDKLEQVVLHDRMFAVAMPRGSGKTTLSECAVIWAALHGHHPFIVLIGATADAAERMLDNIKSELQHNDMLLADYPAACYPIARLEGEAKRCIGQLHHGNPTLITLAKDELILPTIPGSRCSGAIIRVAGITGNIRGAKATRPDGSSVRPTLAVIDDPQTDESARSVTQTQARLGTINGAILGLAGPGKRTAAIVPCTVIAEGDLADQLLNREKNPQWQGERTRLVYAWPTNEELWSEYAEVRAESFRNDGDGHEATEFYATRRIEMDAGAVVAWPARHDPHELTAIQHAMNLRQDRGDAAFWAEYQNEPLPTSPVDDTTLTADQIAGKLNNLPQAMAPVGAEYLTAFIDVQQKVLFWMVCAWGSDFTGWVLDYGTWPDQRRRYFSLRDVRKTLDIEKPGAGLEGQIYHGLEQTADLLLAREWKREGGGVAQVDRCMIDANWGASTDTVYQFCRQSPHSARLLPSHGKYIGAASQPLNEGKPKPGERSGAHWRIPPVSSKRAIRHCVFDTNHWKSFVHARLAVSMGDRGCLSLFGKKPAIHRLLAEHLTSEVRVRTEGRGRTVDEWKLPAHKPDNHWLDCLVGSAVAASVQGAKLGEAIDRSVGPRERKRIKLSELRR